MKKIIALVLILAMVCPVFAVSADEAQTYGADNLNNEPGDLIIGFIGGSITEGSGATIIKNRYTSLVVENYFKKNFPKKNVIESNVAVGGTPSGFGHIRIKNDLLSGEATPDVVFVEFACNDGTKSEATGIKLTQNMESMVRQMLELPKIPVIIFIYATKAESKENPVKNKGIDVPVASHGKTAKNYGIYEIDLNDYIWDGVADKKWTWNYVEGSKIPYLSNDTAHPNDFGYGLYADFIVEKLEADAETAFRKLDPKTPPCGDYVYGDLEEIHLSDERVKLSDDWKFVESDPVELPVMGKYISRFFPNGYYETERCRKSTVELEFTGRGFGVQYKRNRDGGFINWEVFDEAGNSVKSGSQSTYYATDSARTCGTILANNLPFGKYKLVLKGDVNSTAYEDYKKTEGAQGGSGTYLGIESIVVETSVPEDAEGIRVLLNDKAIKFDVYPQIINDRTMVPLRAIFEALGAEVSWDDATKTVTAKKDDVTISMTIGANSFKKNDAETALDSPATIVDSRTLVPVRAIAESFGSTVGWNAETKIVSIK